MKENVFFKNRPFILTNFLPLNLPRVPPSPTAIIMPLPSPSEGVRGSVQQVSPEGGTLVVILNKLNGCGGLPVFTVDRPICNEVKNKEDKKNESTTGVYLK